MTCALHKKPCSLAPSNRNPLTLFVSRGLPSPSSCLIALELLALPRDRLPPSPPQPFRARQILPTFPCVPLDNPVRPAFCAPARPLALHLPSESPCTPFSFSLFGFPFMYLVLFHTKPLHLSSPLCPLRSYKASYFFGFTFTLHFVSVSAFSSVYPIYPSPPLLIPVTPFSPSYLRVCTLIFPLIFFSFTSGPGTWRTCAST